MEAETKNFLDQARSLLLATQSGAVEVGTFEEQFLAMYSELPDDVPDLEADALDRVFWAVERYVPEPSLRNDTDLDESGLKRVIANCLDRLGHAGDAA